MSSEVGKPEVPKFETKRLLLKKLELSMAKDYQKRFAHWNILQYLSHAPWPYPKDGAREWIKNTVIPKQGKGFWFWGIFLKENPEKLIGCIHLQREGNPSNRGFWLAHEHWGKGFMSEAVLPILNFAFSTLKFKKLVFAHAVQNKASRRIKEKTGGRLIGVRKQKFNHPKFQESEI